MHVFLLLVFGLGFVIVCFSVSWLSRIQHCSLRKANRQLATTDLEDFCALYVWVLYEDTSTAYFGLRDWIYLSINFQLKLCQDQDLKFSLVV